MIIFVVKLNKMITLQVRNRLDFHDGGCEAEIAIERFAFRAGLRGTGHNDKPVKVFQEFEAKDRPQITDFVRRVKRSSELKDANVSITIVNEKVL